MPRPADDEDDLGSPSRKPANTRKVMIIVGGVLAAMFVLCTGVGVGGWLLYRNARVEGTGKAQVAPPAALATPVTLAPPAASARQYLKHPVNKPAFEAAVMGRSMKEVSDLLGPPKTTLETSWVYPVEVAPGARPNTVVVFFRSNSVFKVEW